MVWAWGKVQAGAGQSERGNQLGRGERMDLSKGCSVVGRHEALNVAGERHGYKWGMGAGREGQVNRHWGENRQERTRTWGCQDLPLDTSLSGIPPHGLRPHRVRSLRQVKVDNTG